MAFAFAWNWLSRLLRRQRRRETVRIVMYTRQGCHLCDEAWQLLRTEQERYGYRLEQTDVDEDAELVTVYGEQVPVVTIDGKVRFRGRVNLVLLRRLLGH